MSFDEILLEYLQKQSLPVQLKTIQQDLTRKIRTKVSSTKVKDAIGLLNKRGYDVKEILTKGESAYYLIRYGKLRAKDYYMKAGSVSTPLLLTADWHIGSKGWSELAYNEMLNDVDKFGVKHIIHCGDLLQGLGVYRTEREDLTSFSIDEQVDDAVDYIKQLPSKTKFHLIQGGHEQKITGSYKIGFDSCAAIARRIKNVNYYHYIANLSLNKEFNLLMAHGKGGSSYSSSYNLEKFFRNLTERPHILAMGHWHEMTLVEKPPNYKLFKVGSLQRESIYILRLGLTAQIGWYVLHDYDSESAKIESRYPKVY